MTQVLSNFLKPVVLKTAEGFCYFDYGEIAQTMD